MHIKLLWMNLFFIKDITILTWVYYISLRCRLTVLIVKKKIFCGPPFFWGFKNLKCINLLFNLWSFNKSDSNNETNYNIFKVFVCKNKKFGAKYNNIIVLNIFTQTVEHIIVSYRKYDQIRQITACQTTQKTH